MNYLYHMLSYVIGGVLEVIVSRDGSHFGTAGFMAELITDLATIKTLAEQRRAEFEALRMRLEDDDTIDDRELDALVDRIAEPIVAAIDCKTCANCCRTAQVALTIQD
ncbi:MAG: hypothetical protein CUN53_13015, partial [Phototrophicales bacterium]